MLYEMYRSPSLMTYVQRECQASSKSASREFDLSTLLKQPYLQAIFAETLRYRNHIFMTRFPDPHDMYVNGWRLPAGKVVMTCSTVQHMNSTLWNTGNNNSHPIDTFWPGRFLVSQELSQVAVGGRRDSAISLEHDREAGDPNVQAPKFSTKGLDGAWIPFGGGTQMCPGQKLAKAEIFLAVATLLANFDIELKDPAVAMSVNWWHFGTGVAKPADKLPFRVRRRL
jgi:cytochrome P450